MELSHTFFNQEERMKQPQVAKQLRRAVKNIVPKKKSHSKVILLATANLAVLVGVAVAVLFISDKALAPLQKLAFTDDEQFNL